MNVIAIKGRLTRDPELSSFKNSNGDNKAVCRFSVAVNRDYGALKSRAKEEWNRTIIRTKTAIIAQLGI